MITKITKKWLRLAKVTVKYTVSPTFILTHLVCLAAYKRQQQNVRPATIVGQPHEVMINGGSLYEKQRIVGVMWECKGPLCFDSHCT